MTNLRGVSSARADACCGGERNLALTSGPFPLALNKSVFFVRRVSIRNLSCCGVILIVSLPSVGDLVGGVLVCEHVFTKIDAVSKCFGTFGTLEFNTSWKTKRNSEMNESFSETQFSFWTKQKQSK